MEHTMQIVKIKFETNMLKSSLCDYIDAYILVKGTTTITVAKTDAAASSADTKNKQVTFEKLFTIQ